MTISSQVNKSGPYLYNGATTSFAYGFKISDETHIRVVETVTATGVETDLVLGTDYTVTGVGSDAGTVVISPARAAGKTVILVRNVPFTQELDLQNQGAYFAQVVEDAFDLAVARAQQLQEQIGRAVVVPVSSDPTDIDALIGGVVGLLGVVDDVVIVAGIAGDVSTVAGISADVTAVVAIAADVTAVAGITSDVTAVAAIAADVSVAADNIAAIIAAPDEAAAAAASAAAASASAVSVDGPVISMSRRRSLIVNGSMIDSQETGNTLGAISGYFPADQFALYFTAATAAMSIQRVQSSKSLAGAANKLEFKTTTAKASLGASDFVTISQPIEGSRPDFVAAGWGAAGAKQFMFRVDQQLPAGLYHIHVRNSDGDRHIAVPFTATGTEAVIEVAIPGDTSGTWLTGEGQIGMFIDIVLAAGATLTNAAGATWGSAVYYAASTQFNILSSTSNVARIADVGLRIDPDATGVYGAYEVGETDAVYRSERYWWGLKSQSYDVRIAVAQVIDTNGDCILPLPLPIRMGKVPTVTAALQGSNIPFTAGLTLPLTPVNSVGTSTNNISLLLSAAASGWTIGFARVVGIAASGSGYLYADARLS